MRKKEDYAQEPGVTSCVFEKVKKHAGGLVHGLPSSLLTPNLAEAAKLEKLYQHCQQCCCCHLSHLGVVSCEGIWLLAL